MAICRTITVTAPSRLHFGLFAFGRGGQPGDADFGGLGMMIAEPAVRISVSPAIKFLTSGPHADRAAQVVARLIDANLLSGEPKCRVEMIAAPDAHIGLGTGTQLALATAMGVLRSFGVNTPSIDNLARAVGRGARSAIGTHGFARGGLLVDAGKTARDEIAPLVASVELPVAWRVVLFMPHEGQGVSGGDEQRAFDTMPPVSRETSAALRAIAFDEIVPAARGGRFDTFCESLYQFNRRSGECYAAVQGGPYATERAARWIERLRSKPLGVRGVGQSSWGPTLFAFAESADQADRLASAIEHEAAVEGWRIVITAPSNHGAVVEEGNAERYGLA